LPPPPPTISLNKISFWFPFSFLIYYFLILSSSTSISTTFLSSLHSGILLYLLLFIYFLIRFLFSWPPPVGPGKPRTSPRPPSASIGTQPLSVLSLCRYSATVSTQPLSVLSLCQYSASVSTQPLSVLSHAGSLPSPIFGIGGLARSRCRQRRWYARRSLFPLSILKRAEATGNITQYNRQRRSESHSTFSSTSPFQAFFPLSYSKSPGTVSLRRKEQKHTFCDLFGIVFTARFPTLLSALCSV
jgi:hypothetical protein